MSKNYKIGSKFRVTSNSTNGFNVGEIVNLVARRVDGLFEMDNGEFQQALYEDQFELVCEQLSQKLKPAKQALADAIHQNGGWRGGKYAVYGKHSGKCSFLTCKPQYLTKDHGWFVMLSWIVGEFEMKPFINWHQCVLSRDEYYHAHPKADADGWIEWSGEPKSPVENGVLVDVKLKGGGYHEAELLDDASWSDAWGDESIIAYRLHKPEVKPEFCESVMRSIPDPDANPTIEQLAQDYRNKLDFAKRKQQEADDAKVAADAALGELERAGEALGLLIGIAKSDQEPELVITDWRHLQKGDIVWWSGDSKYSSGEYPVHDIEEHHHTGSCAILLDVGDYCRQWIDHDEEDWKFIRRP